MNKDEHILITELPELDLKRNISVKKIISKSILLDNDTNIIKDIIHCIDKMEQLKQAYNYFDTMLQIMIKNLPIVYIQTEFDRIYTNDNKLGLGFSKGKLNKVTDGINLLSNIDPKEAIELGFEIKYHNTFKEEK